MYKIKMFLVIGNVWARGDSLKVEGAIEIEKIDFAIIGNFIILLKDACLKAC